MKKRKVSFTIQILPFKMTLLPIETCGAAVALISESPYQVVSVMVSL